MDLIKKALCIHSNRNIDGLFVMKNVNKKTSQISKKLNDIQAWLNHPISPERCRIICNQLGSIREQLEAIKQFIETESTVFSGSLLLDIDPLEKKICFLYGKAIDKKVDFQVNQIKEQTILLQKKPTIKSSIQLQQYLNELLDHHRPGIEHRDVIYQARKMLEAPLENQIIETDISHLSSEELLDLSTSMGSSDPLYQALRQKPELCHLNPSSLIECIEEYGKLSRECYFKEAPSLEENNPTEDQLE